MTNHEMMEIAMRQSAEDIGCRAEDFKADRNVVLAFKLGKNARKYYKEPITCNFVSYGNNVVAASISETMDIISEYVSKFEFYGCFETPNFHWLNERLMKKGHKICFMAEYYLPDINVSLTSHALMKRAYCSRKTLESCICRNGATRFVRIDGI